jgi:hypothetical protein
VPAIASSWTSRFDSNTTHKFRRSDGPYSLTTVDSRSKLVHLLQMAYSGEKAAAYAYAGHWRSVRKPAERTMIRKHTRAGNG